MLVLVLVSMSVLVLVPGPVLVLLPVPVPMSGLRISSFVFPTLCKNCTKINDL